MLPAPARAALRNRVARLCVSDSLVVKRKSCKVKGKVSYRCVMALAGTRLISRLRARGVRCSVCNHTQQVCVATQHTSTDIQLQTTHGGAAREPSGQVGSAQVNRVTRVRVVWGGGVGVCACVVKV